MTSNNPQVPWTDEQWELVTKTVQTEAGRARVAATFLPLYGPLPPDADFVRREALDYDPRPPTTEPQRIVVDDISTVPLATLYVKVWLRGAQMADPNLTSALQMFRRAANVLARLEDAVVFQGQAKANQGPSDATATGGLPNIWGIIGGSECEGLLQAARGSRVEYLKASHGTSREARGLVHQVSARIGDLELKGHLGPFAVVLGETLFSDAQNPSGSLVLPSDRIIPFLGGGPLLRSSTLPDDEGIVVALGGAPIDLVVACDLSVSFLQVTEEPKFLFRVHEKIRLRIKEEGAIEHLIRKPEPTPTSMATPTP